jgi:hypothetical protein
MIPVTTETFTSMSGVGLNELLLAVGLFVLTFTLSLVIAGALLVMVPATYFLDRHERHLWVDQHPAVRWSGLILKNLMGMGLIVVGVVLSVPGIPGQGILTILIGLSLLDIPGKRRLERKLLGRPRVFRAVNRLRARFGKPSLVLTESSDKSQPTFEQ